MTQELLSFGSRNQNEDGLPASCLPAPSACLLKGIKPVIWLHGIFEDKNKKQPASPIYFPNEENKNYGNKVIYSFFVCFYAVEGNM